MPVGVAPAQRAKTNYHGLRLSLATTKCPPCQERDNSEVAKDTMQVIELDKFPEDILHHIHSLVPLRDAARAACVSRRFLRSWKCFPNLTFNWKTLGLNMHEGTPYERAKKIADRIYHILKNHSGIGVKTLKLQVHSCNNVITANLLGIWLETAVKSGIVEFLWTFLKITMRSTTLHVRFYLVLQPQFSLSPSRLVLFIRR